MKSKLAKRNLRIITAAVLMLLSASAMVLPAPVQAALPAPNFMPNFPMLAGPQVIIMWTPVPGAVKYNVYMNGKKIGESVAMQLINPAPTEGGEYKFQVTAVDATGAESPRSDERSIKIIKLEPPKGLAALPQADRIPIRWSAAQGAVIYDVFRRIKGEADFKMITSVTELRYEDTDVKEGVIYEYAVVAKDTTGKASAMSESIEATPIVVQAIVSEDKKNIPLLSLPAKVLNRVKMPEYPFDILVVGKGLYVTAQSLYHFPDITNPLTQGEFVDILPGTRDLAGLGVSCGNGNLIYAVQEKPVSIVRIDPVQKTVTGRFTVSKPEPDTLKYGPNQSITKENEPFLYDVVCDGDDNMYVSDVRNARVAVLDSKGQFIGTLGFDPDAEPSEEPSWLLQNAGFVDIDPQPSEITVASITTYEAFDLEGKRVGTVGGTGKNVGQFAKATGIAISPKGKLFASDIRSSSIQVFQRNEDGDWEFYWQLTNEKKDGNVALASPTALAVDPEERFLVVVESIAQRVTFLELDWANADQRPPEEK